MRKALRGKYLALAFAVAALAPSLAAQAQSTPAGPNVTGPGPALSCPSGTGSSSASPDAGCMSGIGASVASDAARMLHGVEQIPRAAVRPSNLKWEVPVLASAAVLITAVDVRQNRRSMPDRLQHVSARTSDAAQEAEFGAALATYLVGCLRHHTTARTTGFIALESMGYAGLEVEAIKLMSNRERPNKLGGHGEFWEGGRSFPSGHAAFSWAFASSIARRHPHNRALKWSLYGLAGGISALRISANQHFPSDVLAGGVLGYVTGAYLGQR